MTGELIASAGEREFEVSVEPLERQWRILIDGRELVVDAVRVKPGTWSLLLDGRSIMIDVDDSSEPNLVHTHQAVTPIALESAQRRRLAAKMGQGAGGKNKAEDIKAPIAGRVVKILVSEGEVAEAGSCVAILEAMKMENEILCTQGGRVENIAFAAGESVDTGAKLMKLVPVEGADESSE